MNRQSRPSTLQIEEIWMHHSIGQCRNPGVLLLLVRAVLAGSLHNPTHVHHSVVEWRERTRVEGGGIRLVWCSRHGWRPWNWRGRLASSYQVDPPNHTKTTAVSRRDSIIWQIPIWLCPCVGPAATAPVAGAIPKYKPKKALCQYLPLPPNASLHHTRLALPCLVTSLSVERTGDEHWTILYCSRADVHIFQNSQSPDRP